MNTNFEETYLENIARIANAVQVILLSLSLKSFSKVAQKWGKMSTIILQLGQYVHLPKFCAIWGKMSWGKMSLGHFVLGHFVSGAKCPWGKMSPSPFSRLSVILWTLIIIPMTLFCAGRSKHQLRLWTSGGGKDSSTHCRRTWTYGQRPGIPHCKDIF